MLLTVCFEAGRFTLTQSSWTVLTHCSRKWMSGQAAALVQPSNRSQFDVIVTSASALRDSTRLSAGGTPFPLDFYLSWMSLVYHPVDPVPSPGNEERTQSQKAKRWLRLKSIGAIADSPFP